MEPEGSLPRLQKSIIPILIQINPVHVFPTNFFKIRFSIIMSFTPSCFKRSGTMMQAYVGTYLS